MDLSSTCVDSAMEVLSNIDWDLSPHAMDQTWALFLDLKFLRNFLLYTVWFNDGAEDAALGSLLTRVETAFIKATADLRAAYEKGYESRAEHWGPEISKLQQMIQLFKPEIENGYYRLPNQTLTQAHPCAMDYRLLNKFVDSIMEQVVVVDHHKANMILSVKARIKALKGTLGQLTYMYSLFAKSCGEHGKFKDFLIHLQAVILRAAHLSYLCWIRKKDKEGQVMDLLRDLEQKIKSRIPEMIDMYFEVLKASKNSSAFEIMKDGVTSFLNFLLYEGNHRENLLDGLKSLVNAVEECSGDTKLILRDIKAVVKQGMEVISGPKKTCPSELLTDIKLINAEVSLIALLKSETSLMLPVQDKITTLQKGLRFLSRFSKGRHTIVECHSRTRSEVVTKAASLCHSIHANEMKELMVQEINLELADLLMEILESKASFRVSLKGKVKLLRGGMRSLRLFLTGAPEDYEEKANPVLASSEAVGRNATSLVYSLYENRTKKRVDRKTAGFLSRCLEEIKVVNGQVRKLYIEVRKSWFKHSVTFTDELEFFDFLLGNMKELLKLDANYIASMKLQFEIVQQNLESFRSFLKNSRGTSNEELKDLRKRIMEVANEAEVVINTFSAKRRMVWYCAIWLSDSLKVIQDIKMEVMEIFEKKSRFDDFYQEGVIIDSTFNEFILKDQEEVITNRMTHDFILEDQEEVIRVQLFGGLLDRNIVSIVGMPGIGKSTLANKIYNDPQIEDHFLHAWSCISQSSRREILLDILSNNFELPNNIFAMCDDDLCEELNKCLKGKRYLVVLDDLRTIGAWYSIRQAFPDDQNGSRVLITTRFHSVALLAKRGSDPLPLRLLSDYECCWLLEKTVDPFAARHPDRSPVITQKIAKSCKGLPLAVVIIGGLLKRIHSDQLYDVAECISSRDDDPQKQLMKILELSYSHLPNYLKPCFLYFGAFLERKDIAVWKLINLWIAEGLVGENGCKSLEDVAEEYLLDLIDRGLVIVAKRRSNSQVKTCRLPDMVRILCLEIAKNEKIFQLMPSYNGQFSSSTSNGGLGYGIDSEHSGTSTYTIHQCRRLCIHSETKHFIRSRPSGPVVHSLMCFEANEVVLRRHSDISFICHNFKVLRVLDLECINMLNGFPVEIELLVQLRYLAVKGDINYVPCSIANLSKLETFLLKGSRGRVVLPSSLWRVATLRHVYVDGHFYFTEGRDSLVLCNLVTLATPVLSCRSQRILRWYAASIRKLRCIFEESQDYSWQSNPFPSFYFLTNLETLKIFYTGRIHRSFHFDFPLNLTCLTLSGFCLPWDEVSAIGRLPNLEVLKLLSQAFEGYTWDMTEHEFFRLKFLKLDGLDIRQWNASEDCLPSLQRLVLLDCKLLEEVPSSFGDIPTLEMIEVKSCSRSVAESVMKIREAQQLRGNKEFKILTRNEWYCSSSF